MATPPSRSGRMDSLNWPALGQFSHFQVALDPCPECCPTVYLPARYTEHGILSKMRLLLTLLPALALAQTPPAAAPPAAPPATPPPRRAPGAAPNPGYAPGGHPRQEGHHTRQDVSRGSHRAQASVSGDPRTGHPHHRRRQEIGRAHV